MSTAVAKPTRKVIAMMNRDKTSITIILDHTHYRRSKEDGFDVVALFWAAQQANKEQEPELFLELERMLNPLGQSLSRVTEMGYLEKDVHGNYYLVGTSVPLPPALIRRIIEFHASGFPIEPYINFWSLAILNPNKEARDRFFDYVEKFGVTITDKGYAVLYKAVYVRDKDDKGNSRAYQNDAKADDLQSFVAQEVVKVKSQRKGLGKFNVYAGVNEEGEAYFRASQYDIAEGETLIGNLKDLNENIKTLVTEEDVPVYTDMHSQTMDIRLGHICSMDRDKCDPSMSNECSYGLHVGSYQYVSHFGRSSACVILTCLVSPKDVVAVPNYDTSKMRVCQYYPMGIMEKDQSGTWNEIPSLYFEDNYSEFEEQEILQLAKKVEDAPGWKKMGKEEQKQMVASAQARIHLLHDEEEDS